MADDENDKVPDNRKPKGSCLGKLGGLFVFLLLSSLTAALFFISQPQDLTKIDGYGPVAKMPPPRDLRTVLRNAAERGFPVTLTEEELNRYLATTLHSRQGGLLSEHVKFDGVWVNLEPGRAELILERHVLGHPLTLSIFLRIERRLDEKGLSVIDIHRDGGPYIKDAPLPNQGGRFGQLVVPEGFLLLIMPSLEKLATAYSEEISLGFREMGNIRIDDSRISFAPRSNGLDLPAPRSSF
jgi:hypothetical protein